jgi:antitoxin component YwqK of YwqJK toxin-antitoxin module
LRKLLQAVPIVLLLFSCGKKKEILSTGTFKDLNGISLAYETWAENDSVYRRISDPRNGQIFSLQKALTEQEINDSTFSETVYSKSGKVVQQKTFLKKVPAGEWLVWDEAGRMTSFTKVKNGQPETYRAWYDNGQLRVEGVHTEGDSMHRSEYFPDGAMNQEFRVDAQGNGRCTLYYPNKLIRTCGPLIRYSPSGVWQQFDSLGKPMADTVLN